MLTELQVQPLSSETFARFGDVIETAGKHHFLINKGNVQRYHDLAQVDVTRENGHTLINIFRAKPLNLPLTISMLERHPLGSQAFIPLSRTPFLIVVAPPGELDAAAISAFISTEQQGVSYHRGVWHHPVIALDIETDFLVIDRGGPGDNCDEAPLPEACWLQICPPIPIHSNK